MTVNLNLPWPPTGNHYKAQNPWTKDFYLTDMAKAYHQEVWAAMVQAKKPSFGPNPIQIHITAYPPDNRRRDLDNLTKVLFDSLQRSGLFQDDFQVNYFSVKRAEVRKGGAVAVTVSLDGGAV